MLLVYIIPAIVILLILFLALGYLKAPPDTAFIISGLGKRRIIPLGGMRYEIHVRRSSQAAAQAQ